MPLTPEELLEKRYKVIALWIKSPLKINIGDIIKWDDLTGDFYCKGERFNKDLESYPHLFQPMEWWQDRDVKDMPEYVVFPDGHHNIEKGQIVKVFNWYRYPDACIFHNHIHANWMLPSTETDYLNYLKQKQK